MLPQSINQPLAERVGVVVRGVGLVASPFTGSANDCVLLFAGSGAQTGPTAYMTVANSATAGTSVTINKAGKYRVKLYLEGGAEPIDVVYGISQDVAAAGLIGAASFSIAGFVDVQRTTYVGILITEPMEIVTDIDVRPEQEGTGSVVRFHASTAAGAAPAADLIQAAAYYSVERINQLQA